MQIDGTAHLLAQGQDLNRIKGDVVAAAQDGAEMVTVTVVGNRTLDVLVTPGVPITFEAETVPDDDRDNGDLDAPFDVINFEDFED